MPAEFQLGGRIVPWGRRAQEYEAFFGLGEGASHARILDCGAGPSSFAAEWGRLGRFVVAADPAYARSSTEIEADFEDTAHRMLQGMQEAYGRFNWGTYGSPEQVVERRRGALALFGEDVRAPRRAGRYVAAALPHLPFPARSFDLVLCSHFLFLYSRELTLAAHVASLREMLRVGREVRVFPLLDMDGVGSSHLEGCIQALEGSAALEIVAVPFEFRPGDSSMLRLTPRDPGGTA